MQSSCLPFLSCPLGALSACSLLRLQQSHLFSYKLGRGAHWGRAKGHLHRPLHWRHYTWVPGSISCQSCKRPVDCERPGASPLTSPVWLVASRASFWFFFFVGRASFNHSCPDSGPPPFSHRRGCSFSLTQQSGAPLRRLNTGLSNMFTS